MSRKEGGNATSGLSRRDRRRFGLHKPGVTARPPATPLLLEETFSYLPKNLDDKSAPYSIHRREWRSDVSTREYLSSLAETTSTLNSLIDEGISPRNATERFWESISSNPTRVAAGVEAMAVSLESSAQHQTAFMLDKIIKSRIPSLLKGKSRNEKRVINTRLLQTIVGVFHLLQPESMVVQENLGTLLERVLAGWNTEEQIILLGNAFTHLSERRKRLGVNATEVIPASSHYNPQMSEFILKLAGNLEGHIDNHKDETDLRLAVAGYFFVETVMNAGPANKLIRLDLRERSRSYLNKFFEGSRRSPENMLEALGVVAQALKKATSLTKATLSLLLSGELNWQNVLTDEAGGKSLGRELRNFSSLLKGLFALLETAEYVDQARDTFKVLLEGAMAETEDETTGNHLFSQIVASPNFADQQKLFIIKAFLSCMGYEANPEVSDAELLRIFTGSDWRLQMNGKEVIEAHDGLFVAHRAVTQASPAEPPVNSGLSQAEVVFEEAAPTTAQATEPAPAPPVEPPEVRELTREEQIIATLKKIFKENLNQEEATRLNSEKAKMWGEINPDSPVLARTGTLSLAGIDLRLDSRSLKRAGPDYYPRATINRVNEARDNNDHLLASDIGGTIELMEDSPSTFVLKGSGGLDLEGPLADLYLNGTLSEGLFLQLEHRIISLAHQRLVGTPIDLLARALLVKQKAKAEMLEEANGKRRRPTAARLKALIETSKPFLITREVISSNGNTVRRTIVDLDRVMAELKPGENRRLYQSLTPDQMEESKTAARSNGSVQPHLTDGTIVFLPFGYKPTASAITNATLNHTVLLKIVEVVKNPDTEEPETTEIYSTFRSAA